MKRLPSPSSPKKSNIEINHSRLVALSTAIVHLSRFQALMRPILDEHQLQTAQKFKPEQFTDSSTIFKAAFDQYLIVPGLDESDVLAPVDAGLVGG